MFVAPNQQSIVKSQTRTSYMPFSFKLDRCLEYAILFNNLSFDSWQNNVSLIRQKASATLAPKVKIIRSTFLIDLRKMLRTKMQTRIILYTTPSMFLVRTCTGGMTQSTCWLAWANHIAKRVLLHPWPHINTWTQDHMSQFSNHLCRYFANMNIYS